MVRLRPISALATREGVLGDARDHDIPGNAGRKRATRKGELLAARVFTRHLVARPSASSG